MAILKDHQCLGFTHSEDSPIPWVGGMDWISGVGCDWSIETIGCWDGLDGTTSFTAFNGTHAIWSFFVTFESQQYNTAIDASDDRFISLVDCE